MPLFSVPNMADQSADDFAALMGQMLPGFSLQPDGDPQSWTCQADLAAEPGAALLRARFSRNWTMTCEAKGVSLGVYIPLDGGALSTVVGGVDIKVRAGQALLVLGGSSGPIQWRAEPALECAVIQFSEQAVRRVLDPGYDFATLGVPELLPVLDLHSDAGRHFRMIGRAIAAAMIESGVRQHAPLIFDLMLDAAVGLLLDHALAGSSDKLAGVEKALPAQIRRAIDYMEAHMHDPITVGDIAAAAGISLRSLQCGFNQYCGASPSGYLRQLRLEAVHRELAHPQNRLSVGEVAVKWGFTHLGRFAAQYREVYGKSPSQTQRGVSAP